MECRGRGGRGGGKGGKLERDQMLQDTYYFVDKCMTRPDLEFVGKLFDNTVLDF